MKTLPLLACLAVPVAALAADLKDPATVAREWNRTIEQAREPLLTRDALGLNVPKTAEPKFQGNAPAPRAKRNGDVIEVPSSRFYDAPRDGAKIPRGWKAWEYNGQTYWLLQLTPGADK